MSRDHRIPLTILITALMGALSVRVGAGLLARESGPVAKSHQTTKVICAIRAAEQTNGMKARTRIL
jgi:hypothetical protein